MLSGCKIKIKFYLKIEKLEEYYLIVMANENLDANLKMKIGKLIIIGNLRFMEIEFIILRILYWY